MGTIGHCDVTIDKKAFIKTMREQSVIMTWQFPVSGSCIDDVTIGKQLFTLWIIGSGDGIKCEFTTILFRSKQICKMKWQTAKLSLKRKGLRNTRSQPISCVPKTRLFLLLLAAAASKWVLLSHRWMSQIMSRHPRLLMMGMLALCLVVIMTIQLTPERAVLCPSGLMLRPIGHCLVDQAAIVAGLVARVYA